MESGDPSMSGDGFLAIVEAAFEPFLSELGFVREKHSISGRQYCAVYSTSTHSVSISYEPGDEALFILIFGREDGELTDIDDRSKTPRLSDLNRRYMRMVTKDEFAKNEETFASVFVQDKEERSLLRSAMELRLVLPMYLSDAR
jgi:hypothetical protein